MWLSTTRVSKHEWPAIPSLAVLLLLLSRWASTATDSTKWFVRPHAEHCCPAAGQAPCGLVHPVSTLKSWLVLLRRRLTIVGRRGLLLVTSLVLSVVCSLQILRCPFHEARLIDPWLLICLCGCFWRWFVAYFGLQSRWSAACGWLGAKSAGASTVTWATADSTPTCDVKSLICLACRSAVSNVVLMLCVRSANIGSVEITASAIHSHFMCLEVYAHLGQEHESW